MNFEEYQAFLNTEPNIHEPECCREDCHKEACTEVTLVVGREGTVYRLCMQHYHEVVSVLLQLEWFNLLRQVE